MLRPIVGYRDDPDEGSLVAVLGCGHGRHLRHRPPQVDRAWTLDPAARAARLGAPLDCQKCDRLEPPEGLTLRRETPVFTEATLPAALRAEHRTRAGVWARVEVLEGQLRVIAGPPAAVDRALGPGEAGWMPPEHPHRVEPLGEVRVKVGLYGVDGG